MRTKMTMHTTKLCSHMMGMAFLLMSTTAFPHPTYSVADLNGKEIGQFRGSEECDSSNFASSSWFSCMRGIMASNNALWKLRDEANRLIREAMKREEEDASLEVEHKRLQQTARSMMKKDFERAVEGKPNTLKDAYRRSSLVGKAMFGLMSRQVSELEKGINQLTSNASAPSSSRDPISGAKNSFTTKIERSRPSSSSTSDGMTSLENAISAYQIAAIAEAKQRSFDDANRAIAREEFQKMQKRINAPPTSTAPNTPRRLSDDGCKGPTRPGQACK